MSIVAAGIAPIFLLIALGYLLRVRKLFSASFWQDIERLVFYFLFPALLISSIGSADLAGLDVLRMAVVMITATLVVCLGALWLRPRLPIPGTAFASVFQGVMRPNTYLGLSTAAALYGDAGIAVMAVCIVAVIPLVNFLAVVIHLRWAPSANPDAGRVTDIPWPAVLAGSVRNPVLIACLLGAALNLTQVGLPPLLGPVLILIGKAALPLGLMAVGAGLDISTLHSQRRILVSTTVVKMLLLPVITGLLCLGLAVQGLEAVICVLFAALPVSATSYVVARQMGGDGQLMAGIVTATTVTAVLTLPLLILLLPR